MSVEAGGSIENLMEGINTSNESISSIIPFEKREELSRFELTLKQMIDEAKQMAATPSGSEEDIYASLHKSPSVSSFCPSSCWWLALGWVGRSGLKVELKDLIHTCDLLNSNSLEGK